MTPLQAEQFILSLSNLPRKEYANNQKEGVHNLKRMQMLLNSLGNPERNIPHYLHITGTSGKGSVTLILSSILKQSGKKVGTLISPSITNMHERWQINGKPMSKPDLVRIVDQIKLALDRMLATSPQNLPSFFEIITAISFIYFAEKKVDYAVIEVGMGGRYDATNILPHKDAAIITNIGLDHTAYLGSTKEAIAYEKSGIIKKRNRVFTTEHDPRPQEVIRQECELQQADLNVITPTYQVKKTTNPFTTTFVYLHQEYTIPSIGVHQIINTILCIEVAKSLQMTDKHIKEGLINASLPLRMEVVQKKPIIILDGAHNPDKIRTTVETTKLLLPTKGKLHLVLGFSHDKNIDKMLQTLAKLPVATIACTRNTTNPFRKVADPRSIQKQCKKLLPQVECRTFIDPLDAFTWSKTQQKTSDILLVTGSIFLGGEIRGKIIS